MLGKIQHSILNEDLKAQAHKIYFEVFKNLPANINQQQVVQGSAFLSNCPSDILLPFAGGCSHSS